MVANSLNNLALMYHAKGDYAQTEPLYERALAIREKAFGPENPDVAESLNNLAALYHERGDHARAKPLYERALAIREKSLELEHPAVAESLNNLAALYDQRGDHAEAEPLYERAIAIGEKVLGREHPNLAWSLNNLGVLYHEGGDYERAELLYERAIAIREKALGPEHPHVAMSLKNLALLYHAEGDLQQTMAFLRRALEIEERQIELILPTGTEDQARAFMATLSESTDVVLSLQRLQPEEPSTTHLALTTVLRRKGRVLDVISGSLEALREQAGPEERATFDALLSRRDALARRVLRGPGETPLAEHRKALEALRGEVEAIEREAYRRGGVLRAVATPVQLEDVQAQIPANAALVEFVAYTIFDPTPDPSASFWGTRRFAAFVLRREGPPRWVPLGEAEPTLERAHALRQALQDPRLPPALLQRHARAAYDQLFAPIAPLLEGVDMLLLAPEGPLNLIPFGALVDASDRYLIERFTLTYLTSGRDLLRLAAPRSSQSISLVVAAPDYDASLRVASAKVPRDDEPTAARRSNEFGALRFQPLPGTRKEAEAIEKTLGVPALTGVRATEAALKGAKGPRVLHVATHGFFLPDQALEPRSPSGIRAQSPGPGASTSAFALAPPTGENPLLRSGLALAGANQLDSEAQDGILTALEMATLDLWGTKLVVLSACETGLGEVAIGEGVYGLRRALVIAGAEAQLMSLWRVDDVATRELMTAYYQRLVAGEGRAEALRRVQLEMLASPALRRPLYWASFIPIGAWDPLALAAPSASRE
jgi:CHAT domain-containing protein/Tfp pilus assembly protein PilF